MKFRKNNAINRFNKHLEKNKPEFNLKKLEQVKLKKNYLLSLSKGKKSYKKVNGGLSHMLN